MTSPPAALVDATSAVDRAVAAAGSSEQRLELLRELEDLTSLIAARQAELAVAVHREVVAARAALGVPAARRAEGVAAEIALARRESPHRGAALLALARTLVLEMPHTLAALRSGVLSEFRASVVVRETAGLGVLERRAVDVELRADTDRLTGWGTRRLAGETRRIAYRLDPHAATSRAAHARADRHTGLRPAPDTMTWFGALLPVQHGVAVQVALRRLADGDVAAGDGRGRGQLMADGLVERVTGLDLGVRAHQQAPAVWSSTMPSERRTSRRDAVPISLGLVVSDATLLGGGAEPGWLEGYGPLPAPLARDLVAAAAAQSRAALRRLYATPGSGALVAMDSRSRLFPAGLARLIAVRDRTCRTPWCDAPIRHVDHVVAHTGGGPTEVTNGQGLCARCNLAKQAPGWSARTVPPPAGSAAHEVRTQAPHGRPQLSRAPALPPPRICGDAARPHVDCYHDARLVLQLAA